MDHPVLINPSRAVNNEDCRIDFLMYRNIIEGISCGNQDGEGRAEVHPYVFVFIYFYFINNN